GHKTLAKLSRLGEHERGTVEALSSGCAPALAVRVSNPLVCTNVHVSEPVGRVDNAVAGLHGTLLAIAASPAAITGTIARAADTAGGAVSACVKKRKARRSVAP